MTPNQLLLSLAMSTSVDFRSLVQPSVVLRALIAFRWSFHSYYKILRQLLHLMPTCISFPALSFTVDDLGDSDTFRTTCFMLWPPFNYFKFCSFHGLCHYVSCLAVHTFFCSRKKKRFNDYRNDLTTVIFRVHLVWIRIFVEKLWIWILVGTFLWWIRIGLMVSRLNSDSS